MIRNYYDKELLQKYIHCFRANTSILICLRGISSKTREKLSTSVLIGVEDNSWEIKCTICIYLFLIFLLPSHS